MSCKLKKTLRDAHSALRNNDEKETENNEKVR